MDVVPLNCTILTNGQKWGSEVGSSCKHLASSIPKANMKKPHLVVQACKLYTEEEETEVGFLTNQPSPAKPNFKLWASEKPCLLFV